MRLRRVLTNLKERKMDREEIAFSASDGGPVGWVRLRWRQRHRRQERKGHSEEGCGQERRRQAGTVGICNPDRPSSPQSYLPNAPGWPQNAAGFFCSLK